MRPLANVQSSINPKLSEQIELLKFLQEEARKSRDAQRDENRANREFLTTCLAWLSSFLTAAFLIAGFITYKDLSSFQNALEQEAKAETQTEVAKTEASIKKTLNDQFDDQKIKDTIDKAAASATLSQAPRLIKEVITPEVRAAARSAVQNQSSSIRELATTAATSEIKRTIEPIAADLQLQDLIVRVTNENDASAYDSLVSGTFSKDSGKYSQIENALINTRIRVEKSSYIGPTSICSELESWRAQGKDISVDQQTRQDFRKHCFDLNEPEPYGINPITSSTVFDTEIAVVPDLVRLGTHDPSLSVRAGAVSIINGWYGSDDSVPKNKFGLLDRKALESWWSVHNKDYAVRLLLSRLTANPGNRDAVALFQLTTKYLSDLKKRGSTGDAVLEVRAKSELDRMNKAAIESVRDNRFMPPPWGLDMKCKYWLDDFSHALDEQERVGIPQNGDMSLLYDMQNLEQCNDNAIILREVASLASKSPSMKERYRAISLLDSHVSERPVLSNFDDAERWWEDHKATFQK